MGDVRMNAPMALQRYTAAAYPHGSALCWRCDRPMAIMSCALPGGRISPRTPDLQHSHLNNALIDLTPLETGPSHHFQYGPVLLQVAAGVALRLEGSLQNAWLPVRSVRQDE